MMDVTDDSAPDEPVKIRKPAQVHEPAYKIWQEWVDKHPCPSCLGWFKPCTTCGGSRINPKYAVFDV